MKSILEFGQIMKYAFELSVNNLEEGDICVFLEGVHYNQEDFQIFTNEIAYVDDYINRIKNYDGTKLVMSPVDGYI